MSQSHSLLPEKPIVIDKIPRCCESTRDFQPGDILIFNLSLNYPKPSTHNTLAMQRLLNNSGGHKEAVHAAFVVMVDGQKKIAHLRARGFDLDDCDTYELKTLTHIYRPRVYQQEIAENLGRFIAAQKENLTHTLSWKSTAAFFGFLRSLFSAIGIRDENPEKTKIDHPETMPTHEKMISNWSMCSKFTAESYAAACYDISKDEKHIGDDARHDLMNISVNTIPKTLQSYLYRCSNYDYFVMPHQAYRGKIVEELVSLINVEVQRLQQLSNVRATEKASTLKNALAEFKPHGASIRDDFEEAKRLLQKMLPLLSINTGRNMKTPGSYLRVVNFAKSQGLYSDYFMKDMHFAESSDLSAEAKHYYHYQDEMAELYSKYRQTGYSDAEARFECEPSFTKWLHLSPRRNLAAAVTVVPLLYSIPYGLWRTHKANSKKEEILQGAKLVHSHR